MQVDSKPEELDELDRRIMQLKIEQEALKKETDAASKDRLAKLGGELADLEEKSDALTARWQAEKDKLGRRAEAQGGARRGAQRARPGAAQGRLRRAGELTYGVDPRAREEARRRRDSRAAARSSTRR